MTIRIGTRKSKLALWQAEFVAEKLKEKGVDTELVTIETQGDKIQNVAISKIGSKGVFTQELELKLENGEIDIAVHSAKDLQSTLPDGYEILAFTSREKVNDVVVSDHSIQLDQPLVLGTSSNRRIAYFKHYYPHIKLVDIRGNLQTRFQKMRSGHCQGMVLAFAGVHRMGFDAHIRHELDVRQIIPAVGQGSVAVECHSNLEEEKRALIKQTVNDEGTESTIRAERSYLAKMNGGCSIPIYGLAEKKGDTISLRGGIISLDGKKMIVESVFGIDPEEVGKSLAEKVIGKGGDKILKEIRSQL